MWELVYSYRDEKNESVFYLRTFDDVLKYIYFLKSIDLEKSIDSFLIVRLDGD